MWRAWVPLAVCLVLLAPSLCGAASRDAIRWNNFGAESLKQGKLDEAIVQFQQALTLDPTFAQAQFSLAYTFEQLGRLDEAIAAYKQATVLDPTNGIAFNNLGVLLAKTGRNDEAIQTLEQGVKIDPSNAMLQKNLESAKKNQEVLREREDRIAEAKTQAAARPQDPRAAYNVARVLATYSQNDEALEWLGKAMELGYNDPQGAKEDLAFAEVKRNPRFMQILEKR